jgi:8-oxo-dGTP pyrophosphatase MutT (NUDIX family)
MTDSLSPPHRPPFDPERLPLSAAETLLPPVAAEHLSADGLRQRFKAPRDWQPELLKDTRSKAADAVHAAVLVPLVTRAQGLTVMLTRRTAHLNNHAGQISFPGGRCEPDDADAVAAALREAREEVGLASQHVEVLGALPDYLTGTGFRVTPVVGLVHPPFSVKPQEAEVAEIFEVPLAYLMDPANHQIRSLVWEGGERHFFAMPYPRQQAEGVHFIWGATAGMLRNLYRFLVA